MLFPNQHNTMCFAMDSKSYHVSCTRSLCAHYLNGVSLNGVSMVTTQVESNRINTRVAMLAAKVVDVRASHD